MPRGLDPVTRVLAITDVGHWGEDLRVAHMAWHARTHSMAGRDAWKCEEVDEAQVREAATGRG
eukprot:61614-Chlamydomonas_euryale.AAC.1